MWPPHWSRFNYLVVISANLYDVEIEEDQRIGSHSIWPLGPHLKKITAGFNFLLEKHTFISKAKDWTIHKAAHKSRYYSLAKDVNKSFCSFLQP